MFPANERQRYNVMLSLIAWAHIQNDPPPYSLHADVSNILMFHAVRHNKNFLWKWIFPLDHWWLLSYQIGKGASIFFIFFSKYINLAAKGNNYCGATTR